MEIGTFLVPPLGKKGGNEDVKSSPRCLELRPMLLGHHGPQQQLQLEKSSGCHL